MQSEKVKVIVTAKKVKVIQKVQKAAAILRPCLRAGTVMGMILIIIRKESESDHSSKESESDQTAKKVKVVQTIQKAAAILSV